MARKSHRSRPRIKPVGRSNDTAVDAPVEALQGVSPGDAEHRKAAFNIKTIGDLGRNNYFLCVQSIAKLAE